MREFVKFLFKRYRFHCYFHEIPHKLSPSCICKGLCNQLSMELYGINVLLLADYILQMIKNKVQDHFTTDNINALHLTTAGGLLVIIASDIL